MSSEGVSLKNIHHLNEKYMIKDEGSVVHSILRSAFAGEKMIYCDGELTTGERILAFLLGVVMVSI